MRFNLLKHNNLMLRSERRERLEAWAASHTSEWIDTMKTMRSNAPDLIL
jgi:dsDNA-binding SOS-regulon protein